MVVRNILTSVQQQILGWPKKILEIIDLFQTKFLESQQFNLDQSRKTAEIFYCKIRKQRGLEENWIWKIEPHTERSAQFINQKELHTFVS